MKRPQQQRRSRRVDRLRRHVRLGRRVQPNDGRAPRRLQVPEELLELRDAFRRDAEDDGVAQFDPRHVLLVGRDDELGPARPIRS